MLDCGWKMAALTGRSLRVVAIFVFLVLGWITRTDGSAFSANCLPGYRTDDELSFSQTPGNLAITCKRSFVELVCCVKGYTSIKWLKQTQGVWTELRMHGALYLQPNDKNQTLTFQQPLPDHAGKYMCVAEDEQQNLLNNSYTLRIKECQAGKQVPKALLPVNSTVPLFLGDSYIISCSGFFGLEYRSALASVIWIQTRENSTGYVQYKRWIPEYNSVPPSSNINFTYENGSAVISSTLHITNLTEEDYGNYTCAMVNVFGNDSRTVQIVPANATEVPPPSEEHKKWMAAVAILASLIVLSILVVVIVQTFSLDIKLFIRDRFRKVNDDGRIYDAFVIHSDEESVRRLTGKGGDMINILENQHGYKLLLPNRDFLVGPPLSTCYNEGVQKSRCILFVMTPSLLQDEWADFVYQMTASRHDAFHVFLIFENLDKSWQPHQEAFKKTFTRAKRKVKWTEKESQDSVVSEKKIRSTSYDTMSKKKQEFWKRLRWALPKPLSLGTSPHGSASQSNGHAYAQQSSTSSLTPLSDGVSNGPVSNGKPSSPPYAFQVV